MKYLKEHNIYTSNNFFQTKYEIKQWLDCYYIKHYTIDDDLVVHVDNDVDITYSNLYYIPFQFGRVYGDFHCQGNEFSTLKGFPNYIKYDFQFNNNNLNII